MKNINKNIANTILAISLILPFAAALPVSAAVLPNWNTTGSYVIDQHYNGSDNPVNVTLSQDNLGNLTGSGTSGAYTWVITSGSVSGNNLTFTANYTATPDAVTPLTVMTVDVTIAQDGTMSGTWSDNYQGGSRTGDWTTTSGVAVINPITTQTATNIGLIDATLNGMNGGMDAAQSSFWVSTSPFVTTSPTLPTGVFSTPELGAVSASTPFSALLSSVVGLPTITPNTTYYYAAWSEVDGTWNPGAVMSFTTLAMGSIMTQAATNVSSTDATLNGTNGNSAASGHSFWVSLSPFVTTSLTLPTGVFSTPDMGAIAANAPFSASLSSVTTTGVPTNLPAITPNTTYYYAAWSEVDGTWNPGAVMSFTTLATGSIGTGNIGGNVIPGVGTLHVDSVTMTKTTSTADGTFDGGWKYVFNITAPSNEPKLSMEFANWTSGANTDTGCKQYENFFCASRQRGSYNSFDWCKHLFYSSIKYDY